MCIRDSRRVGDNEVARSRLARIGSRRGQVLDPHGAVRLDVKVLVHDHGLVEGEGRVRNRIGRTARAVHGGDVNQVRILSLIHI